MSSEQPPVETTDTPPNDAPPTDAPPPAAPALDSGWRDALGPDIGVHPAVQKYGNDDLVQVPRGLVKGFVESQRFLGGEKIPVPNETWTESDWSQHYERLGRPQTPDEYGLETPELPEDFPRDENVEKALTQRMFDLGLSKQQAQELYKSFYEVQGSSYAEAMQNAQQVRTNAEAALKKEFGTAFDAKIDLANRAFHELAGSHLEELRVMPLGDGSELGNHPTFIRMLAKAGEVMGEHKILGDDAPTSFTMSPEEAKSEYAKLENQRFTMEEGDPELPALIARMEQVARMGWPTPTE